MEKYSCSLYLTDSNKTGLLNGQTAHIYINGLFFSTAKYGETFHFESSKEFEIAVSFSNFNGVSKFKINDFRSGKSFQLRVIKTLFRKFLGEELVFCFLSFDKLLPNDYITFIDLDSRNTMSRIKVCDYFHAENKKEYESNSVIKEYLLKIASAYRSLVDEIDFNTCVKPYEFEQIINIVLDKFLSNERLVRRDIDDMLRLFKNREYVYENGTFVKGEYISKKSSINLNFGDTLVDSLCLALLAMLLKVKLLGIQDSRAKYARRGIHAEYDLKWKVRFLNECISDWLSFIKEDFKNALSSDELPNVFFEENNDPFFEYCETFVDDVYSIMSEYCCFEEEKIKDFAFMNCFATTGFLYEILGEEMPKEYLRFFDEKVGLEYCNIYLNAFRGFLEDPHKIDFQWIPRSLPFDIDEYLDEVDGNVVNIAELILISFCYDPSLFAAPGYMSDVPKKKTYEVITACERFIAGQMEYLLDVFDEFNTELTKDKKEKIKNRIEEILGD